MADRGNQSKESQGNGISLFPQCSIVGTFQCPDRVFTHCIRCGRAVCLSHIDAVKGQECLLNASICVVCLHSERYPRDPSVGRWRPYWRYRPGIS
jgi:hypothetical protein